MRVCVQLVEAREAGAAGVLGIVTQVRSSAWHRTASRLRNSELLCLFFSVQIEQCFTIFQSLGSMYRWAIVPQDMERFRIVPSILKASGVCPNDTA